MLASFAAPAFAQEPELPSDQPANADRIDEAERRAAEALSAPSEKPAEPAPPAAPKLPSLNLLELAMSGGVLMIPIAAMSFLVVLFAFERWLGLRRRKIIPPELVAALGQLAARPGGLDPKQAYKLCQQFPSTAASVFRSVLLKVGRPHSEVEFAVKEASEREAAKLYKNVRPIELAVTITPLLGLLGTVQGMIQAFFITANMPTNVNKAESLAGGIYVALVTTFAGLTVAIPAAILAHYFEGRIQSLFRDVDELLLELLPQLERFEGKLRVQRPAAPAVESEPRVEAQPAAARK
ncbi:MAG TPA: MotA/TolQ/ExbB proton channel family protein [Pirellulales bacterium]|nr:MotA/TolQ/ExbB proton channel family protein [Pirellulales bacterium]